MPELLDSVGDPELADIERNPDSMICSPDATGPAVAAALATPASAFPPAAYPSHAKAATIFPDVRPAYCARLAQRPRLVYFIFKVEQPRWKSGKLLLGSARAAISHRACLAPLRTLRISW